MTFEQRHVEIDWELGFWYKELVKTGKVKCSSCRKRRLARGLVE